MDFNEKVAYFTTALSSVYQDEENRGIDLLPKLELKDESLTEDFTAMFYAMFILYKQITGDDEADVIDFSHICNKLVFQRIMEEKSERKSSE